MFSRSPSLQHDPWLLAAGLGATHGATDVQLSRRAADRFARITAVAERNAARREFRAVSARVVLRTLVGQQVAS